MDSIRSVLIIDDDDDDIFIIQDRLEQLVTSDCTFVSCCDKQIAIDYLKERTFDLCILDYRLAGFKGIEILEAVSNADLATPIIMLTGQNDEEVAKQAIKLGAQDFVMKSLIDSNIFEKSIGYAIARKELEFAKVLGQRNQAENVAKDKFIAHLSHELRTPLTSILGYTSLLLEDQRTADFQKELNIISKNGKHLLNLLNDVLDLSKIAAGKFELKETTTNLQQALAEVHSLVTVTALDKGLFLDFSSMSELPVSIKLDELRFKQVLVNLIGNAVKFTDKGGVSVLFEYVNDESMSWLQVQVVDTGIGMAKEEVNTIFSPFKQIEDVANRKAGGAGLGLSICAEIVKQMKGIFEVASVLGEGTTFTLKLPCEPIGSKFEKFNFALNMHEVKVDKVPHLNGTVLIVDDVFEIRQLVGFYVAQTNLTVLYAKHGKEALDLITNSIKEGNAIDGVVMDLHMPVMTGKEAVLDIVRIAPHIPVVAMTAAMSKGLKEELLDLGFTALISKPIDKAELLDILSDLLPSLHVNADFTHNHDLTNNTPTSANKWVHLVEDDEDSAAIMTLLIESLGYQVVHSNCGTEALSNVTLHKISHHLLDLGLPDIQGEALIAQYMPKVSGGNVYILSGNQPDSSMLNTYSIKEHLIKPISKDVLSRILDAD